MKRYRQIGTHNDYHSNLEIANIANQNQALLIYQ